MTKFDIHAIWDADAGVWSAYSDEIPGLSTEAETWDKLLARVADAAIELLDLNQVPHDRDVQLRMIAEQSHLIAA